MRGRGTSRGHAGTRTGTDIPARTVDSASSLMGLRMLTLFFLAVLVLAADVMFLWLRSREPRVPDAPSTHPRLSCVLVDAHAYGSAPRVGVCA